MMDTTGQHPSVREAEAEVLLDLLGELIGDFRSMYDLGCGLGYLVRAARGRGIDCVGIDHTLLGDFVGGRARLHLELDKPLLGLPRVDVTTSFEVVEHVAEEDQRTFWSNARNLAPVHFCTINYHEKHAGHVTIRDEASWIDYLGEWFKRVEALPCPIPYWEHSHCFLLEV